MKKDSLFFTRLMESLREAVEINEGRRPPSRVTIIQAPKTSAEKRTKTDEKKSED